VKPVHTRDFDLLVVGEALIEFSSNRRLVDETKFDRDIGGADIYTAVAAARQGASVGFISAVGRDPFHGYIRERLQAQGVNTDNIIPCQGYNGCYFLSRHAPEHREYLYHHPGNASKSITPQLIYEDLIENTRMVYASSELQSVSKSCRHAVFKTFHLAHTHDIMVAFDPNLRLQRWGLDDAKEALWGVLPLIDVIFPSSPDETKALLGYERPLDVIGFLWDRGVSIVAVKNGAEGCMVGYDGHIEVFPSTLQAQDVVSPVLLGSVFNGAFLHGIAKGYDPFTAARFAISCTDAKGGSGFGIESIPQSMSIE